MTPTLVLILGSIGMITMASGIVIFIIKYQNKVSLHEQEKQTIIAQHEIEILRASIQGTEIERNRIASELHDDIAASLAISKMLLVKNQESNSTSEYLENGITILDESIEKIRTLSSRMSINTLQKKGLTNSITGYLNHLKIADSIELQVNNLSNDIQINVDSQIHAFRIFQEFLNNTIKYAKPTKIEVHLYPSPNHIFRVTHNGIGLIDSEVLEIIKTSNGNGLYNIQHRAKLIPASINWSYESGKEYHFELAIEG
jgi:signal transduction histidine kinase